MIRFFLFIIFCFVANTVFCQTQTNFKIPDSLKERSYEELLALHRSYTLKDSLYKTIYSNTILLKAKQEKNTLEQARGYRLVSFNYFDDLPIRIAYLDSSISISKGLSSAKYPAVSYSNLGGLYYTIGNYTKALESYLKALDYSKKSKKKGFYYMTSHNIGRLKSASGEDEEAIKVFKKVLKYEDSLGYNNQRKILTLLALANSFRKLERSDSASYYNKKAIDISINKYEIYYYYAVLGEGINLYSQEEYKAALDSVQKSLPFVEDYKYVTIQEFIVNGYLYRAKLFKKLNRPNQAFRSLKKLDQYLKKTKYSSFESREAYEMLISYFKEIKDKDQQLLFTQKLIKYDSILYQNYKTLGYKIIKEYDTPNLIQEEKRLIDDLSRDKSKTQRGLWVSIIISIIVIILLIITYLKKYIYKKRYNAIVKSLTNEKKKDLKDNNDTTENIGISEDIVNSILDQLQKFEKNCNFLSSNITIGKLANDFETNSKYISKIINYHKKKNFVLYINELRVNYVTEKLQNDKKLRNYTLHAIAREIGFNSSESFSRAFYKIHGISPSFYIKNIKQ